MQAHTTEHQFNFPTDWKSIYDRIQAIDPIKYASTRNFENGALTLLGPYISRGVISTKSIFEHVNSLDLEWKSTEKLVQELAWRDYWQQIWLEKQSQIESDLNFEQKEVLHSGVPAAIVEANTGIEAIDAAIDNFYKTGYLHNHMRMYIAAICCNIGKYHWSAAAKWMYANLLDGDLASNHLSWQWVAGTFSNRKYVANQENINKYFNTAQGNTFLDVPYEAFNNLEVPAELMQSHNGITEVNYPESVSLQALEEKKTLVYNYYNLDPLWYKGADVQRVLLIEPAVFERYPISQKCMDFAVALSTNIADIKIFVGSFTSLQTQLKGSEIVFKEHPLNTHYRGVQDDRDWMTSVNGYFPGFFKFWNKVKKELVK
ncbi:MAG: FAD-binding domain-containing protein [Crocinitomicaceae bacterium]